MNELLITSVTFIKSRDVAVFNAETVAAWVPGVEQDVERYLFGDGAQELRGLSRDQWATAVVAAARLKVSTGEAKMIVSPDSLVPGYRKDLFAADQAYEFTVARGDRRLLKLRGLRYRYDGSVTIELEHLQ